MMRPKHIGVLLIAALAFLACDDSTDTLGMGMLPESDGMAAHTMTFDVTTQSYLADAVYAKTSTGYVGRFTDREFGDYTASFLTELNCTDNFKNYFPDYEFALATAAGNSIPFVKGESRRAFIAPATFTVTGTAKTQTGTEVPISKTFNGISAKTLYKVLFDVNSGNIGGENNVKLLTDACKTDLNFVKFINLFERNTGVFLIKIEIVFRRQNKVAVRSLFAHGGKVVREPILTDNAAVKIVIDAIVPRNTGFAVFFKYRIDAGHKIALQFFRAIKILRLHDRSALRAFFPKLVSFYRFVAADMKIRPVKQRTKFLKQFF